MTCVEIETPGGPEVLRVTERPDPLPAPGELVIRVAAAGVNRPDLNPFELRARPGFRGDQVQLANGSEATLIVGREGGRVVWHLVQVDQRFHYHVHAVVSEPFFKENEAVLLRVMKSLTGRLRSPGTPACARSSGGPPRTAS